MTTLPQMLEEKVLITSWKSFPESRTGLQIWSGSERSCYDNKMLSYRRETALQGALGL